MGYQRGSYALGYVDHLRVPIDWLYDRPAVLTSYYQCSRTAELLKRTEIYSPPSG